MRLFIIALIVLLPLTANAAQKTRSAYQTDVSTDLPSGVPGAITAAKLRTKLNDISDSCYMLSTDTINTILPTQSGNSGKFLTTNGTSASWATVSGGGGGSGDVVGPASSTDNAVARFDLTTGKLIQDSAFIVNDSGVVTSGGWNGSAVGIAYGGTGINFTDPNADTILFWDDSAGSFASLSVGSGLSIAGTTLSATGGGTGDVVGPASATDNTLPRFDTTTGKLIQGSGVVVDDSNNISGAGTLASAAHTVTSTSANSLAVGANGSTNPVLQVDAATASVASGIKITGNVDGSSAVIAGITSGSNAGIVFNTKGTGGLTLSTAGSGSVLLNSQSGTVIFQQAGNTKGTISSAQVALNGGGSTVATSQDFSLTNSSETGLTAGTESVAFDLNMGSSKQWSSNTSFATQRFTRVRASTIAFASATGTVTDAYTFAIDGPPVAGTNAVITNPYALGVLAGNSYFFGKHVFDSTITAGGTTGNQTINKPTGTVNIAAAGTSVTVTNSLVTTSSIVHAVVRTNDSTATIKNVVPGSGSFTINLGAAATAETSIGFLVTN